MDGAIINKIKALIPKITIDGIPNDINAEIILLKEIILLFNSLSSKKRKELEIYTYIPNRNLGSFLFQSNQYDEALKHFEIANKLYTKYDDMDSANNDANTRRMTARCMIDMGLRDDNNHMISTAKRILTNLLMSKNSLLTAPIINQIEDDLSIIEGIEKDKIVTSMSFILPFPLKLCGDSEIEFRHNDLKCSIKSSLIQSKLCPFESDGFIEMTQDKHGISMHSEIKLFISKFVEPRGTVIVSLMTGETAFKPLVVAIEVLNTFIDHYKVSTLDYWIPRVTHKMLSSFMCEIHSNEIKLFSSPYSGNGVYKTYTDAPVLTVEEKAALIKHYQNDEPALWEILYANAKDSILVKSFREAIIAINAAFENYLALKVPIILSSQWSNEKIKSYLNGQVIYAEFFLSEFIDEERFNIAKSRGIIKEMSPSTFHMIKTCCLECNMRESNKKYNSLVFKIRHGRNDVSHGNHIKLSEEEILRSLYAFDEFIRIFDIEV